MVNKKAAITTCCRILSIVFLLALYFRGQKMETILTAFVVLWLGFWFIPYCFSGLLMTIFKIEENYGGKLLYDDTDPTNCKFRMVFNFEPEDLAKESTFTIKVEKANLLNREQNND